MILTFRRGSVAVAATIAVALAACGSDGGGETAARSATVVATTTIWADVVANVACGDRLDVESLMPAGTDPHSYEPSLRDRESLDRAALIVTNGLGLEETLTDTIDAAAGVPVFAVGEHVETIPFADHGAEDHAADEDHGDEAHEHEGADPHIWFDPTRIAAALPALADALVAAGADEAPIAECAAAYATELDELDAEIEATLASIPEQARVLVTNHDSLGYFADRYGFEVLGTVIPAGGTLAEASPAELDELADLIDAEGVPAIFAENLSSTDDASALADRLGVDVVALYTDALGESRSGADTYVGLLRTDAEILRDALAGE